VTGARPGWYPDPGGSQGRFRWWNGAEWTDALGDSSRAPWPANPRPVRRARHLPGRPAAVWTLGLTLVVVAGVVLGLVIWQQPRDTAGRAAAAVTPRPSATGVAGELDQSTRRATIGEASMTFPDEPYVLRLDPMRVDGLFDTYFVSGATVHEDYRIGRDWSAVVGLAQLSAVADDGNLEATAIAAARAISTKFFDGQPTVVKDLSASDHAVDGCSGILATAQVHYRIAGLPSRADELKVLVVRLDDGTKIAAFSSVPTDAPAALHDQADAALASLHVG
jgi:hypothetical protein